MLKDLLDGWSRVSNEPIAQSGLAKLAGLHTDGGKSLPVAMRELEAARRDKAAMLDRIRARRRTSFAGDELGDMQRQHKINRRLYEAEAQLGAYNDGE